MDVVIGFSTGDIIWFGMFIHRASLRGPHNSSQQTDPISNRYCRLNKQACLPTRIARRPIRLFADLLRCIYWVPQGRISNSRCTAIRWVPSSQTLFLVAHADGTVIVYDRDREDGAFVPQEPTLSTSASASTNGSESLSNSSPGEWNPLDSIFVTLPPWHPVSVANGAGKSDRDKSAKNPVSHWRVSKRSVTGEIFIVGSFETH